MTDLKKERIESYSILRAVLTILVVIGHCTYYKIMTNYGGVDWTHAMDLAGVSDTLSHRITSAITSIIYSFHMPMFMALSGAVFETGKVQPFSKTVVKKAKRLLIPFVVVTTIGSVPLKYLAGYWANSDNLFLDILVGQYLIQGNTHLWFLPTLFFEFVFFAFITKYERNNKLLSLSLFFVGVLGAIVYSKIPVTFVSNFTGYFLWFYVGMLFERKRDALEKYFNVKSMVRFLLLWLGLFVVNSLFKNTTFILKLAKKVLGIVIAFCGMCFLYAFCNVISKTTFKDWKPLRLIEKYSFGIYLYSDTLNYDILCIFATLCSVSAFGNELAASLLYISRFLITLIASIVISVVMRKLKIKYVS